MEKKKETEDLDDSSRSKAVKSSFNASSVLRCLVSYGEKDGEEEGEGGLAIRKRLIERDSSPNFHSQPICLFISDCLLEKTMTIQDL